jgi:hypothetical protein
LSQDEKSGLKSREITWRELILIPQQFDWIKRGKIKIPRFIGGTLYAVGFGYFMIELENIDGNRL